MTGVRDTAATGTAARDTVATGTGARDTGATVTGARDTAATAKQFVQYKNYDSDILNVCCGVPQNSILGRKLFIIYMNDICNVLKVVKFILFADDTNLY